MKSYIAALVVLLFISCDSDEGSVPIDYRAENELEIQKYISDNNLDATATGTGLHYVINEQGEGAEITATSDIAVKYKGYYTNGSILDQNTDEGITINMQQVILGWVEGIQLFNEGGSGTLLIPSHLAYGSDNFNGIPGGSVLIFDVELIDYDAENKAEIVKYLDDNDMEAMESDSGLFVVIEEEGTGSQPTASSDVTVAYKGYFTDGEEFDASEDGISINLSQVIAGWTEGIPYFKEGGKGKLLIPSSLAYGKYGNQTIPRGAVLIFDIDLKSVN